jgi:AcrR family transcriptional regulator
MAGMGSHSSAGSAITSESGVIDGATVDPGRKGPGRPRSARADEAIIEAAIDLLLGGTTAEALTIEAVAARAGVGKATIYRRWTNKEALLIDAVATLKGPMPEIGGVSVRDDLIALLRPVGQQESAPAATVLPCLISELRRSPELHACYLKVLEPRRELMRSVLRRGISKGELRPDIDIEAVMAMLVGPMLAKAAVDLTPSLDRQSLPARLVDAVWPAIAA